MYVCWCLFQLICGIYAIKPFLEIGGGGWGLELNFLGFQIEENFWEAKF